MLLPAARSPGTYATVDPVDIEIRSPVLPVTGLVGTTCVAGMLVGRDCVGRVFGACVGSAGVAAGVGNPELVGMVNSGVDVGIANVGCGGDEQAASIVIRNTTTTNKRFLLMLLLSNIVIVLISSRSLEVVSSSRLAVAAI